MHGKQEIVIITGASSGLGREVAVQFARRGSTVVLAARRAHALEETARLCQAAGGQAACVTTDVTDEAQVQGLARAAIQQFGRIDVWINNAGVTAFVPLERGDFAEHRRVIETNLFGAMHGARAVLPYFREQRRGVLINVGSVLGKIGQPFVPAYVISKFALRGLSEALRAELADERGIHVCTIYPYAMNTQHFQAGANRVGRAPHAMPPAQSPSKVAEAIVDLARRPRRELYVPRSAAIGVALHKLFPRTIEALIFEALREWHFGRALQPSTEGNLFAPGDEPARVEGDRPPRLGLPRLLVWVALRAAGLAFPRPRRESSTDAHAGPLPRPL
jgi:short-subunit dehydrogenase